MKTFIGLIVPIALVVTWAVAGADYATYVIAGAAVCMAGVGVYDLIEGRVRKRRERRAE